MNRKTHIRGFTLIELLVVVAIIALLISILLPSLGRAREQAKKAFCANNLGQFGRAVHIYVGEYKYFPPNNPFPQYWPPDQMSIIEMKGWDPSMGWLMTYAMRMTPPAMFDNGHFNWTFMQEDEIPDVAACPSGTRELLFNPNNPELDPNMPLEATVYKYAAFYQTSGICRAAARVQTAPTRTTRGFGGRNAPVPDPRSLLSAQRNDNGYWGVPHVEVTIHTGNPEDAAGGAEQRCFIQAIEPSEVDDPGRVYYLADNREWRPMAGVSTTNRAGIAAGQNDGWWSAIVEPGNTENLVVFGARHFGTANIVYLDGHVSSDNQMRKKEWNLAYDPGTGVASSAEWRVATWADTMNVAAVGTQHHIMPQLNVRGWEWHFTSTGQ